MSFRTKKSAQKMCDRMMATGLCTGCEPVKEGKGWMVNLILKPPVERVEIKIEIQQQEGKV